jgi:hypothetical protein
LVTITASRTGGLATAGIAATALSLFHELDGTVMVLLWDLGAAALIVALGGILGPTMFRSELLQQTEF